MNETEIALARAYLARAGQDPVTALICSVRDVARLRRSIASRPCELTAEPVGSREGRRAERPAALAHLA